MAEPNTPLERIVSASRPRPLNGSVKPMRPCYTCRFGSVLILSSMLLLEGCAATERLYPSSDSAQGLHDVLRSIEPGSKLVIQTRDGAASRGQFREVTVLPDSAIVLSAPGDSLKTETVALAEIAYLGERQGWVRPTQIIIIGAFAAVVTAVIVGGDSAPLIPTR